MLLFLHFRLKGSSGQGRPPPSVEYNQLPFSGATQTYGGPSFPLHRCPQGEYKNLFEHKVWFVENVAN